MSAAGARTVVEVRDIHPDPSKRLHKPGQVLINGVAVQVERSRSNGLPIQLETSTDGVVVAVLRVLPDEVLFNHGPTSNPAPEPVPCTEGMEAIAEEQARQITELGYTREHDRNA